MTEVQHNTAHPKKSFYDFSGTHFNLIVAADDLSAKQVADHLAITREGKAVRFFVNLELVKLTTGRERTIAVDKLLVASSKAHPDSPLYVIVPVPAAYVGSMAANSNNSFSRGALQNIIDGLLGFRSLNLIDSVTVLTAEKGKDIKVAAWTRPTMPAWFNLVHPKAAEAKPTEPRQIKAPGHQAGPLRKLAMANGTLPLRTGAGKAVPAGAVAQKAPSKPANRWHAFGLNSGPVDDRNQQVAFDSLLASLGPKRMGVEVPTDDEIIETARLITSLEGSAAPHEISNKQALGRLLGAVIAALGNERYNEQLDDLHFALKNEQENGNDIRKQILMVANTGAIKFHNGANTRPLLAQVFDGLIRRVRGALRRRKENAEAKKAGVAAPVPAAEAPTKKKKKRKKKAKPAGNQFAEVFSRKPESVMSINPGPLFDTTGDEGERARVSAEAIMASGMVVTQEEGEGIADKLAKLDLSDAPVIVLDSYMGDDTVTEVEGDGQEEKK